MLETTGLPVLSSMALRALNILRFVQLMKTASESSETFDAVHLTTSSSGIRPISVFLIMEALLEFRDLAYVRGDEGDPLSPDVFQRPNDRT